ncbi:CopG family transcriptional regulator [Curtanaerobium respiraculi]|jgi:hypothetical protein|uniref:ribbon-helix-helix domain-containing protein n=1 Tax=Curtanaerobium respiraculi TaxID=2949669 RepID=UPI0024B39A9E|nr:CopG family transcriptional regulator [Curtanaerobium respiraculi]
MSDRELCEAFGTTPEEVEADVEKFENGDWSGFAFGEPVEGKPAARMRTASTKFYDFELAAIDRAAKKEGISRSAFIRRACDNELISMA